MHLAPPLRLYNLQTSEWALDWSCWSSEGRSFVMRSLNPCPENFSQNVVDYPNLLRGGVIYYVKSEVLDLESTTCNWKVFYYAKSEVLDLESNLLFPGEGGWSTTWDWKCLNLLNKKMLMAEAIKMVLWSPKSYFFDVKLCLVVYPPPPTEIVSLIQALPISFSRFKHFQFYVVDYPPPPGNSKFDSRSSTSDIA